MRSIKSSYCKLPPRQDACEVINSLVEYEITRKLLHKKDNAELLDGNSHMDDNIESGKSDIRRKTPGYV